MELEEVADRLYALPPEEFTAARQAAAKESPELRKEIGALRRPTVAAWVVNALAREDAGLLEDLLSLGPALAEAQRAGAGDELRSLGEQRRALLGAVATRATERSARDVGAAVRTEVESTLEAALADPASADAVRSGRLVRALSFAGFGGVDLEGATATPVAEPGARRPDAGARTSAAGAKKSSAASSSQRSRRAASSGADREKADTAARRLLDAEQAALDAAGALDDAVRAHGSAAGQAAQAAADEEQAEEALALARHQLEEAQERRRTTDRAATAATREVGAAQQRAERARAALDRLRRG